MILNFNVTILLIVAFLFSTQTMAATLLNLRNQKTEILQTFMKKGGVRCVKKNCISDYHSFSTIKEVSRYTDFNQVTHVRVQEYYRNYPVWNAHAVIHFPAISLGKHVLLDELNQSSVKKRMNGALYQELNSDLEKAPSMIFRKPQAEKAVKFAIYDYQTKSAKQQAITLKNTAYKRLVFVDDQQKAHWAYQIDLDLREDGIDSLPAKPMYIIDALTFKIYRHWNNVKTVVTSSHDVYGGGVGGNPTLGKIYYDGLENHLPSFIVKREKGICYLENNETIVKHAVTNQVIHYLCPHQDPHHNNVYWSADFDKVNHAYSPANDAMFAAKTIKQFYKEWYRIPALVNADGSEMVLTMKVHVPYLDNASWNHNEMSFGDGHLLYPFVSLGIAAHEVSHGFTEQHSNLFYDGQAGGMDESFSDMAAQAVEYYVYGKSNWQLAHEIFKLNEAMRYMDQPSKDCYGKAPGYFCSIDHVDQYYEGLNVHFSSGIYNRVFYLLSNMPDWNPRKAFAVMLQANASYWLAQTQFTDGAACVVKAAKDLHYDANAVRKAFSAVGISPYESCTNDDE